MSGVFGVVHSGNCRRDLFYGTDYHSHMGTEYGGVYIWNRRQGYNPRIHSILHVPFRSRFEDDANFRMMRGHKGIGIISDYDPQPLLMKNRLGQFAIAVVGLIRNQTRLASQLISDGANFIEPIAGRVNMVELCASLIGRGNDFVDGLEKLWASIEGSATILILNEDGLIAARDGLGRTPLVIGRKEGAIVVASETCSFLNLGYEIERFLGPGEIILITNTGEIKQLRAPNPNHQLCAFLFVYTSNPASVISEGIKVSSARVRSGQASARRERLAFDGACGMESSGMFHGYGFAMEIGVPFVPACVKYQTWYRSFTPNEEAERFLTADMKQLTLEEFLAEFAIHRLAVVEDSIVRGTQLQRTTIPKIYRAGAREIHIRPDCPPLRWTCPFLRSTRRLVDLAARRAIVALEGEMPKDISAYVDEGSRQYQRMVRQICQELNVSSLRYQTLEDMIAAIGLPPEQLCTYCWTGQGEP